MRSTSKQSKNLWQLETPNPLPVELAERIGILSDLAAPVRPPDEMLDWALDWADHGLFLFPCKRFLGIPLVPKWATHASNCQDTIIEWWVETPNADIGAVPDLSGHYVIVAAGEPGFGSLVALEEQYGDLPAEFRYETRWGDTHVWMKGRALTSHNRLGPGLHVLGRGHFVYLPASLAPDPLWK